MLLMCPTVSLIRTLLHPTQRKAVKAELGIRDLAVVL